MSSNHELSQLDSPSAVTRLQAARALFAIADVEDLESIDRALAAERDAYVRTALARVCMKLRNDLPTPKMTTEGRVVDAFIREEIRTQVVEEMSKVIAHELESTVGFLNVHAREDIGEEYEESRTHDDIQRVMEFLEVLGHLNDAARPPSFQEMDLGDVVTRSLRAAHIPNDRTLLGTSETVVVQGDPRLLKLAITNILLNALEACEDTNGRITVSWGRTDRDSWVAVIDEGSGIAKGFDSSIRPGMTSKPGHFGWGLTIVKRSLASLGSDEFYLRPRENGGAVAELRWPHPTN